MVLGMPTKTKRRKALETLPTYLYDSFNGVIARIRECPIASQAELGMNVLMWLHFAYRPLKVEELQHALAVEKSDTELDADNIPPQKALLDCCLGLVIVDEETLTIRFVHYTLEEYFRKHAGTEFPNGYSSIAETCLTYLNFGNLRQHCIDRNNLETKMKEYAFLNYAARYWGNYVKHQPNNDLTRLANMILDHESNHPPCAIQALYMGFNWYRTSIAQGFSGIHVTAYFGLIENMAYFCSTEREVELKDEFDRTPLSWAARMGHEAVARLLIERNDVDINTEDHGGRTPLSLAAEYGHEAVVRLLIERNDVNINTEGVNWRTPLSWAAENGHEAVVRLLIERNDVDINASDVYWRTPLSLAAEKGHEAVVRLLIERKDVNINTEDVNWRTPLSWAAENGHEAVVRLLIERNDVNINTEDVYWRTPLSWAAENGHEAVVRLLIERKDVDINAKDHYGQTPLSFATRSGHRDGNKAVVQLLIERGGIDIDPMDMMGRNPLMSGRGNMNPLFRDERITAMRRKGFR